MDFPYLIRKMADQDVKSIENINVDEFGIIYPSRIYHRHIQYFPDLSLVLIIQNNLEGFIIGSFTTSDGVLYSHITSIFINCKFRGMGFGSKMMYEFEENSRRLSCKYVNLFVNDRNTSAIGFYRKLRYHVHKKIPKYYNDKEDALEMRKSLT